MRRLERTSSAGIAVTLLCAGLLGACDDYEDPSPPTGPDPDLIVKGREIFRFDKWPRSATVKHWRARRYACPATSAIGSPT